jgi:hypothetical protein
MFDKEDLEDIKGVIRIHKSKNNGQHNGLKKKIKRTKITCTKHNIEN